MRNIFAFILLFLFCLASPVSAKTLMIGNQIISYETPEGFTELDPEGSEAEKALINIYNSFHESGGTKLYALYTTQTIYNDLDIFTELTEIAVLLGVPELENYFISSKDFIEIKRLNHNSMKAQIESTQEIAELEVKLGTAGFEVLEDSDDLFSFFSLNISAGSSEISASVVNMALINGKLLTVNYTLHDPTKAQISHMKDNYKNMVGSFKLTAVNNPSNKSFASTKAVNSIFGNVFFIVGGVTLFMMLPLALLFRYVNKKMK